MESALSVNLYTLRNAVSEYLGKGLEEFPGDPQRWKFWDNDSVRLFDAHIASGLRRFYAAADGYVWSFLRPVADVTLKKDATEIDLPDDFGSIEGPLAVTYRNRQCKVEQTSFYAIEHGNKDCDGIPRYYCIVPKKMEDPTIGQRYKMMFWPKNSEDVVLTMRYNVVPRSISINNPFPYGGQRHGQTIIDACKMAAEIDSDDQLGINAQMFAQSLQNSIRYDRSISTPDYFGYNGDNSDNYGTGQNIREMRLYMDGVCINCLSVPEPCDCPTWTIRMQ